LKKIISVVLTLMLLFSCLPMMSVHGATTLNPNGVTEIMAKDNDGNWDESAGKEGIPIEGGNLSFNSGDWAEFVVNTNKAGVYNISFFTRRPAGTTFFTISVNGKEQTRIETTNGIDWNTSVETPAQVTLEKGSNVIRIQNSAGVALYFRSIAIEYSVKPTPSRTSGPYKEMVLPTFIEAEDFDLGDTGSYSVDGVNNGKKYRKDDKVNIYDNGVGGYYVDLAASESVTYTFDVKYSGPYTLLLAPNAIGKGEVYFDDTLVPIEVYSSKAEETPYKCIDLLEGTHKIKVIAKEGGFKFDYIRFVQGGDNAISLDELNNLNSSENNLPVRIEGEHPIYKELWISENGSDSADGSKANPFLTIERALDEVKAINDDMTGDIIINFASGEYFIDETVQITTEHSGKNGYDIIFKGENKNNPSVIHGGQKIEGWTEYKDGIYKAPVEGDVEFIRNLYVDGQPMVCSRSKYTYAVGSVEKEGNILTVEGDNFPMLEKWEEVETVWQLVWFMERFKIEDLTRTADNKVVLKMQEGAVDESLATSGALGVTYGKNFYLENAMELLDEPGEFYYNKDEKYIYFYPYREQNLETAEVYAPVTEFLINVNGNTKDDTVKNITFDNLDFRYGAWNETSTEGFMGSQATHITKYNNGKKTNHTMPGQITFNRTENVNVTNCRFSCMTAVALLMEDAVTNVKIDGNAFWNLGGTGVVIDTLDHDPYFADDDAKIATMQQCDNVLISNNIFRRVALEYYGCTAIHAYYPKDIKIYHNDISDVPYVGFSVGWGWGREQVTNWKFDASYNRVTDVMKIMNDGGHFYTLGETTGSLISNNYFYKSGDYPGGIYNDSGSANIDIVSNVFEQVGVWWMQGAEYTNNIRAYDNFSEKLVIRERTGRGNTLQSELIKDGHTVVPDAKWTGKAKEIIDNAGLEPGYEHLYDIISFPEWFLNPVDSLPEREAEWAHLNWIQAEDLMMGSEGVGYHKIDPVYHYIPGPWNWVAFEGGFTSQAMKYVVGTDFHGEWWAFEVDVPEDGEYSVVTRASQQGWGSAIDLLVDDELVLENVKLKDDTTYSRLNNTHVGNINLTKGKHIIKIRINGGSFFFDAWALTPVDVPLDQPMLSSDEGVIVSHENHYKNRIYKEEPVIFDDMLNHWAKDDVAFLTEENVINGVGDNRFAPDDKLTKEQATLLTLRALKLTYTEEKEADWLNIAINNGLIDNADNLDKEITREEFAKILENAIIYKMNECVIDLSVSFPDYNEVSEEYAISVMSVASYGLMKGDDNGFFNPKKTLTRAEAATTIKRLMFT